MALPEEAPAAFNLSEKAKLLQAAEPLMHQATLWDFVREQTVEKALVHEVAIHGSDDGQSLSQASDCECDDVIDVFGLLADQSAEFDAHGTFEKDVFILSVRGGPVECRPR